MTYISKLIHTANGCMNNIWHEISIRSLYGNVEVGTEITCVCHKEYVLTFSGNSIMVFQAKNGKEEFKFNILSE